MCACVNLISYFFVFAFSTLHNNIESPKCTENTNRSVWKKLNFVPHQIRQVILVDDLCSCKHRQQTGPKHPYVSRPRHTSRHLHRLMGFDSICEKERKGFGKKTPITSISNKTDLNSFSDTLIIVCLNCKSSW